MDAMILKVQQWLNTTYHGKTGYTNVDEDGLTGTGTIKGLIAALQIEEGVSTVDGFWGENTEKMCPTLSSSSSSSNATINHEIRILQGALYCKGYNPNGFDGGYGNGVKNAIIKFQTDAGLSNADGITTPMIFKALLNMDAFVLLSGKDPKIRAIQQYLNRDYHDLIGLIPCDGIYSRSTNKALIYALQKEEGSSQLDGIWGEDTLSNCPILSVGSTESKFISLLQYALYLNKFDPFRFDGVYDNSVKAAVANFKSFACLSSDGIADKQTWASLLVSHGDNSRKGLACDCATTITAEKAATLVANGYKFVGRYLINSHKMTGAELEIIYGNGLKVFPIFETSGTKASYFTSSRGTTDATSAISAADDLGFCPGTIIYFAVDYDAIDSDVTNYIIPYFKAINDVFTNNELGYKIGIYGARNICSRVAQVGYSCSSFVCDMSSGFSGNLGYTLPQDWAIDQISTIKIGTGDGEIEIDNDIFSTQYNSISVTNNYDWVVDAIKRGFGPVSEERYYELINGVFSTNLQKNISDEADINYNINNDTDWTPGVSDYIALANAFCNNETRAYIAGTKEYNTYKPGFMRVYEYNANGVRRLIEEYKLKPTLSVMKDKFVIGFEKNALRFKFFDALDRVFITFGVLTGAFFDTYKLYEDGQMVTKEEWASAIAATVVTNGLTAYFCSALSGIIAEVFAPELPVISAIVGGVIGGLVGYFISHKLGTNEELYLKNKFEWALTELFGDF